MSRRFSRKLIAVVLLLAALVGLGAFVIHSDALWRFVLQREFGGEDTHVQARGVAGDLYGPMRLAEFRYETAAFKLHARDIRFRVRAGIRGFRVDRARIGEVVVEWKGGAAHDPAASAPSLPVRFDATVDIAQLRVRAGAREYGLAGLRLHATSAASSNIEARLRSATDDLNVELRLDLAQSRHALTAALKRFDPAQLNVPVAAGANDDGALPAGAIDADLAVTLVADTARVRFNIAPASRWHRSPLSGEGNLVLANGRLRQGTAALTLGGNRARLSRHAGGPIAWHIDAPLLSKLGQDFSGVLRAHGDWRDDDGGQLRFSVAANALRLPGERRLQALEGQGQLGFGPGGALTATLTARDFIQPGLQLDRARVAITGTAAAHRVEAHWLGPALRGKARVAGGLADALAGGVWRGELTALDSQAPRILLRAPARFEVTRSGIAFDAARVSVFDAELLLDRVRYAQADGFDGAGRAHDLPVSILRNFADIPLRGDLRVDADFNVRVADKVNAEVTLARTQGDVVVEGFADQALGLSALAARLSVKDNVLDANVQARGQLLGTVDAKAATQLSRRGGSFGIAADAPFAATLRADLPTIAWVSAFARERVQLAGGLRVDVQADGRVGAPRWRGGVTGERLAFKSIDAGIDWRDGSLSARLVDSALLIERLSYVGATGGEVIGRGELGLKPPFNSVLEAEVKALGLARPDAQLVVSGKLTARLRNETLAIAGNTRIDRARIELRDEETVTRSDDVTVVDAKPAPRARRLRPQIDVEVDLGDKFLVDGRGLDARLEGVLRLFADRSGLLRGRGNVRVAAGHYSAYAQRLTIERGVLSFNGLLDNPALDILALRKDRPVQAGVAVTGTALAPVVRLVSIPEVPDADKLAWLVLGKGIDDSSREEIDLLGAAAAALLARGESVSTQARIAQYLGVDEVRLTGGGGLETAMVTVGKRLSKRLYVSYDQALTNAAYVFTARYALSPRWSVQTQSGSRNTALDLFYTINFD